MRNRYSKVR